MNFLSVLDLTLVLIEGLITTATKSKLDDLAISALRNALKELQAVRGTKVTKTQLESLRVKPKW